MTVDKILPRENEVFQHKSEKKYRVHYINYILLNIIKTVIINSPASKKLINFP